MGNEYPALVGNQDALVETARTTGAALEVIDIPNADHGFEGFDEFSEHARGSVHRAMSWVAASLQGQRHPSRVTTPRA